MMTFKDAVKTCMIKKFATKSGRASRAEYWFFQLFLVICEICLVCISLAFVKEDFFPALLVGLLIFDAITLIPNICVLIRRLHDVNISGGVLLTFLIPILSFFAELLVFFATLRASTEGENKYGPNPLNQPDNSSASALANASAGPKLPADKRQADDSAGREQTEEITDVDL